MKVHFQLVQTNAQRWQAAEQEVQARLAEYKGGRTPVNVVLQSQLRRAQAQIDYYRALAEYSKSINYVHYIKGTLLQHNNIELAEGCWNKKAYWDALERARERSAGRKWQYGVSRPGVVREGVIKTPEEAAQWVKVQPPSAPPIRLILTPCKAAKCRSKVRLICTSMNDELYRQPIDVDDKPLDQAIPAGELLRNGSPTNPGKSVLHPTAEVQTDELRNRLGLRSRRFKWHRCHQRGRSSE